MQAVICCVAHASAGIECGTTAWRLYIRQMSSQGSPDPSK